MLCNGLGVWEGNAEEGISYYQRALDVFLEMGNKRWEASSLAGINFLKRFGKQGVEEEDPMRINLTKFWSIPLP
ncbi:hypothetical protein FJZ31_27840 [Candidatus Poribacteria bacterium]|nr:hypothetical protein [Candidatus Poribacteria bacterium]